MMTRQQRRGIRAGTRIPIELPVSMRWKSPMGTERLAVARTGNMSGNGLFIQTPLRLPPQTKLQLTVALPREIVKAGVQLACQGRVVQDRSQRNISGILVVIDDYELR